MKVNFKASVLEAVKIGILVILITWIQGEVIEIRRDLHGSTNGIAVAQGRYSRELGETKKMIRSALEDTSVQFTQARKILLDSSEKLRGEREEIERLIDDRTGELESTLNTRLLAERQLIARESAAVAAGAEAPRSPRPPERDPKEMKRKMVYPTVQLRGEGTVGSGVLVYSETQPEDAPGGAVTFILTAHHVVLEVTGDETARKRVEDVRVIADDDDFDPQVYKAELVLFDRERDAALLRLISERRFPNIAEFAPRETLRRIDIFTPAYAVGCPLGNRPLPTVGEVSTKSKVVGDQVFWMLNAPTFFGNSGGGIYLGSTCQLIGISSMIYTYGKTSPAVVPHMGLFVPLETLYDWLDTKGHSFIWKREPVPKDLLDRYGLGASRKSEVGSRK